MSLFIVLIRVALTAVFGVAGVTKVLDQRGTREAVKNFGAPQSLAPALAILLPAVELSIAAGLLVGATAWTSALAALLLLCLFIIAIGVNLARGETHDCHCFGQLYSRPLGWSTLVRNVVFALAAGLVMWQSGKSNPNIADTLAQLSAVQWLMLLGSVSVLTAAIVYLQRRSSQPVAQSKPDLPELPLDSIAPPFELAAYEGGRTSLDQLLNYGKPLLLIFTNPHCGPCVVLFKEIKEWQIAHSEQLTIALISKGTIKENFVNVARNRLGQVLLQEQREVAEQYGANLTPTAVLVTPAGRIASSVAAGADEIRNLLDSVLVNGDRWSVVSRISKAKARSDSQELTTNN